MPATDPRSASAPVHAPTDSAANENPVGFPATTIEDIHEQIMGEQPGVAEALRQQWHRFSERLDWTVAHVRTASGMGLDGWESPGAKGTYLDRQGEALDYMRDVATAAATISGALFDLSRAMREGQRDIGDLWTDYQTTMAAWDAARRQDLAFAATDLTGHAGMAATKAFEVERSSRVGDAGRSGSNRAAFKALWDAEARRVKNQINTLYAPGLSKLSTARITVMEPFEFVPHPRAFGADLPALAQPPVGPPPAATVPPPTAGVSPPAAPVAPPPPAPVTAPPGANLTAPPGAGEVTAPPVTPSPVTSPVPPPGAGMLTPLGAFGTGTPPAPAGSVITNSAGLAPPGGITNPLLGPPGAVTVGPAGQIGGPVGVTGATGSLPPGLGTGVPPGMGMPPRMSPAGPPGSAAPRDRRQHESPPTRPGAGTTAPDWAPPVPGTGIPPGAGAPGAPASRQGEPEDGRAGGTAAGDTPEAFLPPAGSLPPVLGGPPQQRREARPGGAAEAPGPGSPGTAGRVGGGTPPVLRNGRHTGPRPTYTQRRAADQQARRERAKRFRELAASEFAHGLAEGTSPVLDRVAPEGEHRVTEVPAALQASQRTVTPDRHARPHRQADRAARRIVEQPAPAADGAPHQEAWEVETPGGPVLAGGPAERRSGTPLPALGGHG